MSKKFASQADLEVKKTTFAQLSAHCWAYTAEGDPNTGVIIGDDAVLICDALATPVMAQSLIAEIRKVTDKPIKYVVLSHYDRFPRLFNAFDSIPSLTWPTLIFQEQLTLYLSGLEVKIMHVGPGHTKGDTIVWVPSEKVLFSGDLMEADAACYTGDAQLEEWPATLDALAALKPEKIVPGRGPALDTPERVAAGLAYTRDFVTTLLSSAKEAVAQGMNLKQAMAHCRKAMDPKFGHVFIYEHCLPFDVTRAVDEASGIKHPRIWTAERDKEMWHGLQATD